jgi:preprotein translocase subunit YajC
MGDGSGLGLLFKIGLGLVALFKFFKTPADAMTKLHVFLAQAAAPSGSTGNPLLQLAPLVLMFAAMYFLLIAPQRKKQKEHEKMLAALAVGDEVVTAGGIYGVITSVKDDRYVVRIGDNNAKVEVGKSFVSALVKKASA